MKTISVCTPCYNEIDNVETCYRRVKAMFDEHFPNYKREHIFADNCSNDGTAEKLREIAAQDPSVKVILNARNFGIVRSSFNGICNATGDAVFMFVPADLQDPPELMPQFVKLWEQGYDVVYGQRMAREEFGLMRVVRNLYYSILKKLSIYEVPLNLSDFQLLDQKIIKGMRRFDDYYPFVRIMPFLCSANTVGVPYKWEARAKGVSKNRLFQLIDQGLNGIISTSNALVRIALIGGMLMSVLSVGYAILSVIVNLLYPDPRVSLGMQTLICGMFFFNGILLFFIGMIGEYIMAIHSQVRRAPMVIEKERINF
jgi:glycosyltransferase involved in cell wall biosynthesis